MNNHIGARQNLMKPQGDQLVDFGTFLSDNIHMINQESTMNEEIINYELQEIANQVAFESSIIYCDFLDEDWLAAAMQTFNIGPGWDD
jgi:hypothetical protein